MGILQTQEILGVRFISSSFQETLEEIIQIINEGKSLRIMTANPEFIMYGLQDPSFQEILQHADIVVPDGIGIILAGKIQGKPFKERIAGFDLTMSLLKVANEKQWKVYLLGASPEVMEQAHEKVQKEYPEAHFKSHHGFFSAEEEPKILEEIKEFKPQILLAALGVPKQEIWLQKHLKSLPVNLGMGVGGTFDILSGKSKRAPLLWQRLGVEWLYRLLQEPWRWKRMLALPRFLGLVILDKFRLKK